MKRYITYFLSFILATGIFTSCEVEDVQATFEGKEDNVLTLRISTDKLTSRATEDGEDANNENLINTLDCFFYISATDSAVCRKTVTGLTYEGTGIHEITISFDDSEMKALFGDDYKTVPAREECLVYVIANLPSGITVWNDATIKSLKERTLTGDFTQSKEITVSETKKKVSNIQTNFVMDSDGVDKVTLEVVNYVASLSGHVPLYRAAAKVGLFVYVPESIRNDEGNNQTIWSPVPGSMEVKFHNGLSKGNIDNTTTPYTTITDNDYFETDRIYFDVTDSKVADNGITYNQTTSVPFYTYPTSAAKGSYFILYLSWQEMEEKTNDNGETVLQGKGVFKNCFYQIPINKLEALVRNNYYRLLLNVGVLGTESGMVELTPSYTVCEWNTEDINTKIEENVYLVVQEHDVTINNKNSYAVGYASSHDIEVQILSITQPYYAENMAGTTTFYNETKNSEEARATVSSGTRGTVNNSNARPSFYRDCSVSVVGNTIVLNHEVVNMGEVNGTNYDIAPYTITIYVKMVYGSGANDYYEDQIKFTQYPAIYVVANKNSNYTEGDSREEANDEHNMFVNSYYGGNSPQNTISNMTKTQENGNTIGFFGTAPGLWITDDNDTNVNPNMYVINVTSLSDNTYTIGDPREIDIDTDLVGAKNGTNSIWASAVALYDTSPRELKYYYPTDGSRTTTTTSTSTNPANYKTGYVIAPKFRVASSYSVSHNTNSIERAERRCASYQEDGYPAGRWRMPTYAEARFIVTLSDDGKIPLLFDKGEPYWCAQGEFEPTTNGVTLNSSDTPISIRCVYDEWYWGSDQITNKGTFTWGDYPRSAWPPTTSQTTN